MLKVKPPDGYPPEEGRYLRGNDFSPVAVCVILDTFDFAIPEKLNRLVMAGLDNGAALSGMLQTENVGIEKIICNIVANPNIRYIVLCGREASGHLPGESLQALKEHGVDGKKQIIDTAAPTPHLSNIPPDLIERFRKQIITIINLLCKPGEKDTTMPGLNPKEVEKAVWSCYQENPTEFRSYTLYDMGAYPEPPIHHKIVKKVSEIKEIPKAAKPKLGEALLLLKLLPRTDCKQCHKLTCLAFALDLVRGKVSLEDCPFLVQPEFAENRQTLSKLLE